MSKLNVRLKQHRDQVVTILFILFKVREGEDEDSIRHRRRKAAGACP